jgi:membrane associated rhomboid family serine protease
MEEAERGERSNISHTSSSLLVSIKNLLLNIPKMTKILAITMTFLYILGLISFFANRLALIPGFTIPPHFRVWNLVTSGYFHLHLYDLIFNLIALLVLGKYLEPLWGSREFLRFIIIVNFFCAMSIFSVIVAVYVVTHNAGSQSAEHYLFKPFAGFYGTFGGFTVALKQVNPEEVRIPTLELRNKHIPSLLAFTHLALSFIIPVDYVLYMLFGIWFAWIYLRWFQRKAEGIYGDQSNEFSFASFFPECFQPAVSKISNIVWILCRAIFCCKCKPSKPQATTLISDFTTSNYTSILSPADAERRRQIALKALDARLAQIKHVPVTSPKVIGAGVVPPLVQQSNETVTSEQQENSIVIPIQNSKDALEAKSDSK